MPSHKAHCTFPAFRYKIIWRSILNVYVLKKKFNYETLILYYRQKSYRSPTQNINNMIIIISTKRTIIYTKKHLIENKMCFINNFGGLMILTSKFDSKPLAKLESRGY